MKYVYIIAGAVLVTAFVFLFGFHLGKNIKEKEYLKKSVQVQTDFNNMNNKIKSKYPLETTNFPLLVDLCKK